MCRLLGYSTAAILLLGITTAVVVAARQEKTQPHIVPRLKGTVVWPAGMRPAAPFALRDQNGRLISNRSLRGHIWAITFLDSRCTRECPVEARDLAQVQHLLGRTDLLKIVVVSVLPWYDRPARVRAFAARAGLTGDWHWLLGTRQKLIPVWNEYGIWVRTGVAHTAALYLVDRRGDVRVADGVPFSTTQLAGSIRALAQVRA